MGSIITAIVAFFTNLLVGLFREKQSDKAKRDAGRSQAELDALRKAEEDEALARAAAHDAKRLPDDPNDRSNRRDG